MSKSGLADSPFFKAAPVKIEAVTPPPIEPKTAENERLEKAAPIPEPQPAREEKVVTKRNTDSSKPEGKTKNHDVMQANMHASNDASMQALTQESIIEVIRKSVKDIGKDSATYRFTAEEKKALLELGFSYKMMGYKTSENEITRIAINFLLEDQKQNGKNSVIQRVLDALNQ